MRFAVYKMSLRCRSLDRARANHLSHRNIWRCIPSLPYFLTDDLFIYHVPLISRVRQVHSSSLLVSIDAIKLPLFFVKTASWLATRFKNLYRFLAPRTDWALTRFNLINTNVSYYSIQISHFAWDFWFALLTELRMRIIILLLAVVLHRSVRFPFMKNGHGSSRAYGSITTIRACVFRE